MEVYTSEAVYVRPDKKRVGMLLFFLCGVVSGTLIFNSLGFNEQTRLMIYSDYIARRIKLDNINKLSLFRYIIAYRFKEFVILIILGMTRYRYVFHMGYVFYQGVKNAALLCLVTVIKGKMAILYFFSLVFPQMIVYIFLICYIIKIFDFENLYRRIEKVKSIALIIVLFFVMCLLEAFVNPLLL